MARQAAVVAENNFLGGLVTETTPLRFPPNACTDLDNVTLDFTGTVARRLGMEYESNYVLNAQTSPVSAEIFTEFTWYTVGGNGNRTFVVSQQGNTLHFYDSSMSLDLSANKKSFTVDLNSYKPTGSGDNPYLYPCSYSPSRGSLVVVNEAIDPILLTYNEAADTITVTSIKPYMRDFIGLDSAIADNARPSESVSSLKTNNPNHAYNLYNQGWATTDALSQWDTARSDMPSNCDIIGLYRASATDSFENNNVTAQSPGNTLAARGHYRIEPAAPDRVTALLEDGVTGVAVSAPTVTLGNIGTVISAVNGSWGAGANGDAFDSSSSSYTVFFLGSSTSPRSLGKNLGTPYRFTNFAIRGDLSVGFYNDGYGGNVTLTVYGSNVTPTTATSGTSLGTATFADDSANHNITCTDLANSYQYVWVNITPATAPGNELRITNFAFTVLNTTGSFVNTAKRYKATTSFAGRVWYAGLDAIGLNSYLLFSRIIQKDTDYAKCYQANDPTSEDNPDLLPDDGGVIVIPDIGGVRALFAYQSSLLVFATNGVWRISGGGGSGFRANDYAVHKLSSTGINSATSVVDIKGIPAWWGEDGIYTIEYQANYDSFATVSVTDAQIASFFQSIPSANRQFAKAAYDDINKKVYYLYRTAAITTYGMSYDSCLVYDTQIKAFYKFSFGALTNGAVRGIVYAVDGSKSRTATVKFLTATASNVTMTWSELKETTYHDWVIGNGTGGTNYSSYFITGYRIDGKGIKFFQPNYVFVFLNQISNSSCYMQALFDWTTSSSEGKWSSTQQIYNSGLLARALNFRKLKVRGKGRAMQFKFVSETGKPFEIVGWSIAESANSDV